MSDDEYSDLIELDCSIIYKRKDGILVFNDAPERERPTMAEIKKQLDAFLKIQKGERSPLLVIVNNLQNLGNSEKKFMHQNIERFATKMCMVSNSRISTFVLNLLLFLNPPPIPSRILKTEEEAVEWLLKK